MSILTRCLSNILALTVILIVSLTMYTQGQDLPLETSFQTKSVRVDEPNPDIPDINTNDDVGSIKRFEVGIHFANIHFGTFDPFFTREFRNIAPFDPRLPYRAPDKNPKDLGIGARFGYRLSRFVTAEAEANWFFQKEFIEERPLIDQSPFPGGQKFQMVFGPKIGKRWTRVGVFGKARPGFLHFVAYPVVTFIQQVPPGEPFLSAQAPRRATFFNMDVGGVFEYYPTDRTIFRFDIGDTIVRYNAQEPKEFNPSFKRHNLQINVGFGFRF